jgi:hypothetical protein
MRWRRSTLSLVALESLAASTAEPTRHPGRVTTVLKAPVLLVSVKCVTTRLTSTPGPGTSSSDSGVDNALA